MFGSNLAGQHLGGAARLARERFGAIWGHGVGLQGQSYAIPTMQGGVDTIEPYVTDFINFARQHHEFNFLVTRIGCGIAGFDDSDIAPLFREARALTNVWLPESFCRIIGDSFADYIGPKADELAGYGTYDLIMDAVLDLNSENRYNDISRLKEDLADWGITGTRRCVYNFEIIDRLVSIYGKKNWEETPLKLIRMATHGSLSPWNVADCTGLSIGLSKMLLAKMIFLFQRLLDFHNSPTAKSDKAQYFGYQFFSVLTGRWNGGNNDYLIDDLDAAKNDVTGWIGENWPRLVNRGGSLDNDKLKSMKLRNRRYALDNRELIGFLKAYGLTK